jgi:hypothetical protein
MGHTSQTFRASIYRDKGNVHRPLATESLRPESRAGLLALGESFETRAERVKAWNDVPTAEGK